MAGPTTEYLAEQIDKIRDGMGAIREEIQAVRRDGLDESRRLGDIFADQIQEVRENMVREMTLMRSEVGASREALKVEQSLIREDLAALKAQTTALMDRFDRTQDFLKQLLFWVLGSIATVGGGLFWKASQAVHRIDEQGRRIEVLEKKADDSQVKFRESFDRSNDSQIKLREAIDQLRNSLNERPSPPPAPPR